MKLSYCAARIIRAVLPDVVEKLIKDKIEEDKFRQTKAQQLRRCNVECVRADFVLNSVAGKNDSCSNPDDAWWLSGFFIFGSRTCVCPAIREQLPSLRRRP
jgi:hypothetical protein